MEEGSRAAEAFAASRCFVRLAPAIASKSIVAGAVAVAATFAVATERTSFVVSSSTTISHKVKANHNLSFDCTFLNFLQILFYYSINY